MTNKTGPKFIGLHYYQKKIADIEKRVRKPVFFVFSDDILWCKKNLRSKYKIYFVTINNSTNAWKDMLLISQCKQNIVANSSFSWWAKWLNKKSIK
jgi:Na+/melibiose symporter-like transporter